METSTTTIHSPENHPKTTTNHHYLLLLITTYICLFLGSLSSSLLSKYYFIHKGSSRWVSTWVQSAGFPLLLIPIFTPYLLKSTTRIPFSNFTPKIISLSIFIGFMLGFNNLLFSWGNSYLPISTSSLLLSSQLVFNLILSIILVKQKITFSNINCVILLTSSSVLLALGTNHDNHNSNTTRSNYLIGFFCTIGAGLLFALYLPIMEIIYKKIYCYAMVIEMQLIMEISATVLATAGMVTGGGFEEMKMESQRVFDKGQRVYWVTIFFNVVTWQICFMATAGMVFLTSALTGGICMTALLVMNVVGGVVVYGDQFGGVKAVSTVLCGWGFCSYVYGMYVNMKEARIKESNQRLEMVQIVNSDGD